ncbi:MAG: SPOR domain-containing protein [Candidatus Latescibacterota bacterium]
MNRIDGFEFAASKEILSEAIARDELPDTLLAPLQALIKHIVGASAQRPFALYLMSGDDVFDVRNYFAHALARVLCQQVPSTVVVDCDFTSTGMSGIVPQKDALGFLDYLLYGSSLGVVTQEAPQGVRVIAAGSFPVTKKMPVSLDSFADAARRMATQSRLVIFCGPAVDDEDNIHPICESVDLLMHLSYAERFPAGQVSTFEEKLARTSHRPVVSIRISSSGAAVDAVWRSPAAVADETPVMVETDDVPAARQTEMSGSAAQEGAKWIEERTLAKAEFTGLPVAKRRLSSLWSKVIPAGIAVVLIAFLFWWFFINKSVPGDTGGVSHPAVIDSAESSGRPGIAGQAVQPPADSAAVMRQSESAPEQAAHWPETDADSTLTSADPGEGKLSPAAGEDDGPAPPEEEAADKVARQPASANGASLTLDDVYIAKDFAEFAGKYLIHISSFRVLNRAKQDAFYLLQNNYPACVVPVDIDSKGRWYRVYVGPVESREEALQQKIMLDELPRVKFTRITQSPGF